MEENTYYEYSEFVWKESWTKELDGVIDKAALNIIILSLLASHLVVTVRFKMLKLLQFCQRLAENRNIKGEIIKELSLKKIEFSAGFFSCDVAGPGIKARQIRIIVKIVHIHVRSKLLTIFPLTLCFDDFNLQNGYEGQDWWRFSVNEIIKSPKKDVLRFLSKGLRFLSSKNCAPWGKIHRSLFWRFFFLIVSSLETKKEASLIVFWTIFDREERSKSGLKNCLVVVVAVVVVGLVVVQYLLNQWCNILIFDRYVI